MGQRKNWLDIMKGIGIILVIAGHFVDYNSVFTRYIFTFHMPLFFFASGYLFEKSKYRSEVKLILIKARRLLLPYLAFCLIGLVFTAALTIKGMKFPQVKLILYEVFLKGQPGSLTGSHLWFLVCLFLTEVLFGTFLLRIKSRGNIALAIVICIILEQILGRFLGIELPWKLNSALIAITFFGVGYFMKGTLNLIRFKMEMNTLIALLFLLLSGLLLGVRFNRSVNMANAEYHHIALFYLAAFAGIFLITMISKLLGRNRFLEFLGRNSFLIFTTHYFIMYILVYLISLIRNTPFTLYALPLGIGLAATLITILIEVPFVMVCNKIRELRRTIQN